MGRERIGRASGIFLVSLLALGPGLRVAAHEAPVSRVSVSSSGDQGDDSSTSPALTADGNLVAFSSFAANLVPGDTNGTQDVFLRDLAAGTTTRVSVTPAGDQGNGGSGGPAISADGRFVAFSSDATNLVAGDSNMVSDIFLWERASGALRRVSVDSSGNQFTTSSSRSSLSGDGRLVAFESSFDVFVHDTGTGVTTRVSVDASGNDLDGMSSDPALSADGKYVAFESSDALLPGDGNNKPDVYLRNIATGVLELISVSTSGTQGDEKSRNASVSADGSVIAFDSNANNLVPGDEFRGDVFVRDRAAGTTTLVSADVNGGQANEESGSPSISGDGRLVAFSSGASDLVASDSNQRGDIFVRDLRSGVTASVTAEGVEGQEDNFEPTLAASGTHVAFTSIAPSPAPDTNGQLDVFVGHVDTQASPGMTVETTTTIRHRAAADKVVGRISAERECAAARKVVLKKKRSGADQVLGRDVSDSAGRWTVAPGTVRGSVYAIVKSSTYNDGVEVTCAKGRSDLIRIR